MMTKLLGIVYEISGSQIDRNNKTLFIPWMYSRAQIRVNRVEAIETKQFRSRAENP